MGTQVRAAAGPMMYTGATAPETRAILPSLSLEDVHTVRQPAPDSERAAITLHGVAIQRRAGRPVPVARWPRLLIE